MDAQRRDTREEARLFGGTPEPVASVTDVEIDGVVARLYRPDANVRCLLVWMHGGGWTVGDLDCCDAVVSALAIRAGCAALSVEYRLAPEHRYPAALDDAWAATAWAATQFDEIAVGGDSAGGNLAAAVALRARDASLPLALQLLVYPVLDPRLDSVFVDQYITRYRSFAGVADWGEHCRKGIAHAWAEYVPEPTRRTEPEAAPALAETLGGVAPTLIVHSEHDLLRGEGAAYARRLASCGVPVEQYTYRGQVHGFFHLVAAMDDAKDAVDRCSDALQRAFGRERRRAGALDAGREPGSRDRRP